MRNVDQTALLLIIVVAFQPAQKRLGALSFQYITKMQDGLSIFVYRIMDLFIQTGRLFDLRFGVSGEGILSPFSHRADL